MCRAFPSKLSDIPKKQEKYLDSLTTRIFDLWQETQTGYLPAKSALTPIEFECLKFVDALYRSFERSLRVKTFEKIELLAEISLKRPIL